eukprot:1356738-Pleurochrysis_carterae.AAC.1
MDQTKKPLTRLHSLQQFLVEPRCGRLMSLHHQLLAQTTRQTTSFWDGREESCQNLQNPQTEPRQAEGSQRVVQPTAMAIQLPRVLESENA